MPYFYGIVMFRYHKSINKPPRGICIFEFLHGGLFEGRMYSRGRKLKNFSGTTNKLLFHVTSTSNNIMFSKGCYFSLVNSLFFFCNSIKHY